MRDLGKTGTRLVSNERFIPGDQYLPGDRYVPDDPYLPGGWDSSVRIWR